jgi:FkbM family methyltransferase
MIRRAVSKVRHYYAALGVRGVLLFVWATISRRQPLCRVQFPGMRHPATVRIRTTDVSVLRQVLLERQYDVGLPFVPRYIIDAGANIGLAAVFFANKYPTATIVAVEPDESNFRILSRNVRPYPRIYPLRGALWRQDGELMLIDPGSGHHGFQTVDTGRASERSQPPVPAFTVASVMKGMNWLRVDLLKVDIEGAEKEVFEACDSWIDSIGACMIELHESIKPGCVMAFDRATGAFSGRTTKDESLIVWRPSWL